MEQFQPFLGGSIIFILGVISLKIFFTLWRTIERKINPDSCKDTPETTFKALKNKTVVVTLKTGAVIQDLVYQKSLYIDGTEYAPVNCIFVQFEDLHKKVTLIEANSIQTIKCV